MDDKLHDHDRGLAYDLPALVERRRALKLIAGAGLAALVGCGSDKSSTGASASDSVITPGSSSSGSSAAVTTTSVAAAASCTTIPEETPGPYPGDGSNGPNVLTESGIVRSDITSSFGSSTTTAKGVPLTINLTIQSASGCVALAGAAVYLWHCDIDGNYSLYSQGVTNENYLRGVQEADSSGKVTFKSIFPAAYSGRWPHIHFEVYPNLPAATAAGNKVATSQLALPEDTCNAVFATDGYSQSVRNLAQTSLARDNVFSDGYDTQLPTIGGSVAAGFTAALTVPV